MLQERKKEKSRNGFIIVLLLRLFNARNIFDSIDNNVITRESVAAPTERTSSFFQLNLKERPSGSTPVAALF
jgi:hypothetical protein